MTTDCLGFKDTVRLWSLTCLIEKTLGKLAVSQPVAMLALSMISKVFWLFHGQEGEPHPRRKGSFSPTVSVQYLCLPILHFLAIHPNSTQRKMLYKCTSIAMGQGTWLVWRLKGISSGLGPLSVPRNVCSLGSSSASWQSTCSWLRGKSCHGLIVDQTTERRQVGNTGPRARKPSHTWSHLMSVLSSVAGFSWRLWAGENMVFFQLSLSLSPGSVDPSWMLVIWVLMEDLLWGWALSLCPVGDTWW